MELALDTKPLLRPAQLEDAKGERDSLEKKLHNPHIQDKGEVMKQIRRLDTTLNSQTPKPFTGKDVDIAVGLEKELREKILQGMPSQEEMRKSPPGAVDKHIEWEKRNKHDILLWKNLQLRLNAGNPDGSVANFEKYRPKTSGLNMDGAQISGKMMFLPPDGVGRGVAFSQEQIDLLKTLAPDVAEKIGLLSNDQRSEVKEALEGTLKLPQKQR